MNTLFAIRRSSICNEWPTNDAATVAQLTDYRRVRYSTATDGSETLLSNQIAFTEAISSNYEMAWLHWSSCFFLYPEDVNEMKRLPSCRIALPKCVCWKWRRCCGCRRRILFRRSGLFNPLDPIGNYSATSNNTKLVHWPLMGGLLHLVQRGAAWAGCGPAQSPPRCTKCNSTPINGHSASVLIIILLYGGSLLCGFNVAVKG